MEKEKNSRNAARRPDCVTETRMGNTILVVLSFSKLFGGVFVSLFGDKFRF